MLNNEQCTVMLFVLKIIFSNALDHNDMDGEQSLLRVLTRACAVQGSCEDGPDQTCCGLAEDRYEGCLSDCGRCTSLNSIAIQQAASC